MERYKNKTNIQPTQHKNDHKRRVVQGNVARTQHKMVLLQQRKGNCMENKNRCVQMDPLDCPTTQSHSTVPLLQQGRRHNQPHADAVYLRSRDLGSCERDDKRNNIKVLHH